MELFEIEQVVKKTLLYLKIKGLYVLSFNYKMVHLTQWTISSQISLSNASKIIPHANFKICFSFLIFSKMVLLFRFIYLLQFRSTYIIGNFFFYRQKVPRTCGILSEGHFMMKNLIKIVHLAWRPLGLLILPTTSFLC